MKKILTLSLLFLAAMLAANAQTLVPTTPLNKNVILEIFTGINCTYCPDGHRIAASILDNNPGRVAVIAIHQGQFSTPSGTQPDYRTTFGNALASQAGINGWPMGTVNRHVFSGTKTGMSRGDWAPSSEVILPLVSPVNVGVETSYNSGTRELTVHVELYYTANSSTTTNYINVALIQNHIFGPQTNGGAGNNYEHMEMLRYLITGQWGDAVTTTTQGSFVERTYTYTIPNAYLNIPCVVENCQVVAFVAESHQEILSGDVVNAIDGTNLYVGDITPVADSAMKAGQPGVVTDFNFAANSNLAGTEPFGIKLVATAPGDWVASFEINGQTVTDSVVVDLLKDVPMPLTLHVTPGDTADFADYTFELSSVNNPLAPKKYFKASVISNVHTLLVNAAGDDNAASFQNVYIAGLEAAGCHNFAVVKSNLFVKAKTAGILTGILNIIYNNAWTFPAFTDPEAIAVKALVNGGANLLVAGQDVGWDIMSGAEGSHGTAETQDLYTNYLKAAFVNDGTSANNKLVANASDPIYGTTTTSTVVDVNGGNMYPDQINPVQDAATIFYYNTTFTKGAAVKSLKDQAKVVYFGIGLEMIQNLAVRNDVIKRTYDWFMEGVGIDDPEGINYLAGIQCFPNPADKNATILVSASDRNMLLEISDLTGKIVLSETVMAGSNRLTVTTSTLANGICFLRLMDGNRVAGTGKLVVQH